MLLNQDTDPNPVFSINKNPYILQLKKSKINIFNFKPPCRLRFQALVHEKPPVPQREHSALQNLKFLNPIRIQRPNWIRKTARNYSIHHSNKCTNTVLFILFFSDEICSGGAMSNTTMCPICDGCNSWRLNETCAVSKVHCSFSLLTVFNQCFRSLFILLRSRPFSESIFDSRSRFL